MNTRHRLRLSFSKSLFREKTQAHNAVFIAVARIETGDFGKGPESEARLAEAVMGRFGDPPHTPLGQNWGSEAGAPALRVCVPQGRVAEQCARAHG
jgi:hypothetical protein